MYKRTAYPPPAPFFREQKKGGKERSKETISLHSANGRKHTKKNSTQKLPLSVFHTDGGSFIGVFRILLMGYKTGRTPHAAVLAIRAIPCLYSDRKRGIRAGCFCRPVRVSVSAGFWGDFCYRAACPCLHCKKVRSGAGHPCRSGGKGRIG